jgi:N-acetylmuramoyl-L-alanine amidase
MKILRHRLYELDDQALPHRRSPNMGGRLEPEYLVMHYTAGATLEGAVAALTNPKARASAHLVIGRDGAVVQLVPFNRVAWHAGASRWEGYVGMNRYSIGIELDNAGKLKRHGNHWRAWFGREYDNDDVIVAAHKHGGQVCGWHAFPTAQIEAALEIGLLLFDKYDLKDVVGHDDIAPGRKLDPGPAFPMHSFRARLVGRREDEGVVYETVASRYLYARPNDLASRLPGKPLPRGTRVEILGAEGIWRLVDVLDENERIEHFHGWMSVRHLIRAEDRGPGAEGGR